MIVVPVRLMEILRLFHVRLNLAYSIEGSSGIILNFGFLSDGVPWSLGL
jgi:hypothetical protein